MLKRLWKALIVPTEIDLRNCSLCVVQQQRTDNRTHHFCGCDMEDMMGLDLGTSYRSDKQCREFYHFIADVEQKKMAKTVKHSSFVSIVVDGATDSSVTEQEIVYICTACAGQVSVNFLTVAAVEKADAKGIYAAVTDQTYYELETNKTEFMCKFVGLGSDGAAVM